MVKETRAELDHPHRDESFRNRLLEFVALYKLVVDTLVKQKTADLAERAKVTIRYYELTPRRRAAPWSPSMSAANRVIHLPAFKKSSIMLNNEYLAVILLMKFKRNPFFSWLLGLFDGGAMAPNRANDPTEPGTTPASKKTKGKKRGGVTCAAGRQCLRQW
eukprot:TRINITY_DN10183_c0_g1_i1.p1 TRINITY_DN10183_c0_g1~~TRINITY_DN10183_c0_g1_i1.p1  ORF type:complete len:161 (+),score=29.48 TRINITY_DN10183_c0_g1_i1:188-670(+)